MTVGDGPQLVVFDFDDTFVNTNSDTFINRLAPDGGNLPETVVSAFDGTNWTNYMRGVFEYLHESGITADDIRSCLQTIPLVDGMRDLVINLEQIKDKYELIVISDANTYFIETVLEWNGIRKSFRKLFTNPASFNADGCLQIDEFHRQDWCEMSAKNLCKGHILDEYVGNRAKDGVKFSRISYVGDGYNDLCPSMRLRSCDDYVFARKGYKLQKILSKQDHDLLAKVFYWEKGSDILKVLEKTTVSQCRDFISPTQAMTVLPESPTGSSVPPTPPPSPAAGCSFTGKLPAAIPLSAVRAKSPKKRSSNNQNDIESEPQPIIGSDVAVDMEAVKKLKN